MSLLYDAMEPVVMLDKTRISDGEGGFITTWVDGAEFEAAITFDSTMAARVAEKEGVTSLYTVTVGGNVGLEYHDVFRRLSDGKIFRVTSNGNDKKTPDMASFRVRQVTAEGWEIPG